ncbi:MAG: alginate export family protein [Planctomycetes bacterium]|nr:alginate export family protein [Planctomycetota bacterium]
MRSRQIRNTGMGFLFLMTVAEVAVPAPPPKTSDETPVKPAGDGAPPAAASPPTQPPAPGDKPAQTVEEKAAAPSTPPKAKPKFLDLRYDEDFSYLDGDPESYEKDFFDPIKNVHLSDDWRLTLGGEVRFRMEAETNKTFGTAERAQDTFTLFRYFLHADFKYRKLLRVFVQGVAAFDEDRDLPRRAIDENRWDLHQMFFDLRLFGEQQPWTLRVGRQELRYGAERLVSPLEWATVRRRFDAVKLFAKYEKWDIDLWYAKPVIVQRKQHDRYDEDHDFYGAYVTYKGIPRHALDFYFFATDDTGNRVNPNGNAGDRSIYTLGSRFSGKTGAWDYDAELAGQWGHWAGDTVQAWSWSLDGGYTFEKCPWKPRIGSGFDWASGDEDPFDGKVGTFDQLFPLGHKYLGFLDLIGRQNTTVVNVNLAAWPVEKKVRTAIAYHAFWLNANRDAVYDAGGAAGRRDATGLSDTELGEEVDITVLWQIDVHSSLLLGWSHFWHNEFVEQTGPSQDPDLFYVQYAFKF